MTMVSSYGIPNLVKIDVGQKALCLLQFYVHTAMALRGVHFHLKPFAQRCLELVAVVGCSGRVLCILHPKRS